MQKRLIFVDPLCPRSYCPATIETARLGGTEATLLRIAMGLAEDRDVVVCQNRRVGSETVDKVSFRPLADIPRHLGSKDLIIVINSWKVALKLRRDHPDIRIVVWLHCFPGRKHRHLGERITKAGIKTLCVSETHAETVRTFLGFSPGDSRVSYIYNPLRESFRPVARPRDPNRLLFASAPHKGLTQVFEQFDTVRKKLGKELRLRVADPGYLAWETGIIPQGVSFLGRLDPAALMSEMQRGLCLFYPQTHFAETFGLVLAEANACGMPVLVDAETGANAEIVSSPDQLVDGNDIEAIIRRLQSWRERPPLVKARQAFRLPAVISAWRGMIDGQKPQPQKSPPAGHSAHVGPGEIANVRV
ncbi:glycosyltransferase [Notoacmeibacter sp. MSK16QG-6]|uniref:glycosyltransferase n=1 Tax=Notoacmeibacter sp. MSK16QG-6 TaxID=2957982 RepID=UPI00209FA8B7|nr:glycosyltransferase [Notoacmeibacter sp. MSK16QG-6]MCP1200864.1 glycosyltransferase [Notoacmeibacter sp. MSK16QG-6]